MIDTTDENAMSFDPFWCIWREGTVTPPVKVTL